MMDKEEYIEFQKIRVKIWKSKAARLNVNDH